MKPRKRDIRFPARLRLVEVSLCPEVRETAANLPETVSHLLSVARYLGPRIAHCSRETVIVAALNVRLHVVASHIVSIGTIDRCFCNPRDVFAFALLAGAYGIVMAHNHTSSDIDPSKEDREVTQRIAECGRLLNIRLFDHIVIAGNQARSITSGETVAWTQ